MTDVIIVVNSGSSSLKFALFPQQAQTQTSEPLLEGKVTGIGRKPVLSAVVHGDAIAATEPLNEIPPDATHEWLITQLVERLCSRYVNYNPIAAGHRVVHGGREFDGPVIVDELVRQKLEQLAPLAPLHQPHNLAAIDAIAKVAPQLPQIACFDTSFHRTQPRLAQLFGLPHELSDAGVIRYGFHGLSYQYIADVLPDHLGRHADGRVIVAHLGNGASMCAMQGRQSVASSMGFTPLHGLMMGRRCGSLDAGVVLHLLQNRGMKIKQVEHMLYRESGLLGVSGVSNNMKVLHDSADPRAREAIDLFCYRAACEAGSLVTTLKGLDTMVFTAGIGENSTQVRKLICDHLAWLGIELDQAANDMNATIISTAKAKVKVLVVPTSEETVIAGATRELVTKQFADPQGVPL